MIPTHDRRADFSSCIAAIAGQVDRIYVIAHDCDYPDLLDPACEYDVIGYEAAVPNISMMWNFGLDAAREDADGRPYFVAVLNDDAIVPNNWFEVVTNQMEYMGAAAGHMGGREGAPLRMSGYAFILRGSADIRADEELAWWYGDDMIEQEALHRGGLARVDGHIEHRHPNQSTVGPLREQAEQDRVTYMAKMAARGWA